MCKMDKIVARKTCNTVNIRHTTRRFGVMAAVARAKCSANLEVYRPPEVQCKPPLRQAAGTLAAMQETQWAKCSDRK
jgi:hypothetical protein